MENAVYHVPALLEETIELLEIKPTVCMSI